MKKDVLSVGTALAFTLMFFASFISAVMALTDWYDDYSPDHTAYAYVAGAYVYYPPPLGYYDQAHKGSITEGNVIRYAFTRFRGFNNLDVEVYNLPFNLANYTSIYKIYSYEDIWFIETCTDSGYGTIPQSAVTVKIGPPGIQ